MPTQEAQPVHDQPAPKERKHNPFTASHTGGRALSAMMFPAFMVRAPRGFGVLTTTGRRTGKKRRKCVRVVFAGETAYLVMLGPVLLGDAGPRAVAGWLWNIRANPSVGLRIRGATLAGSARELEDADEMRRAREAYCSAVHAFDYMEYFFHTGERATSAGIQRLHRHWFDNGVPLAIDPAR